MQTSAAQDGVGFSFEFRVCPALAYMLRIAFSAFSLVKSFRCLKYSWFSPLSSSRAFAAPLPHGCSSALTPSSRGHSHCHVACNLTPLTLADQRTYLLLELAGVFSSSRLVTTGLGFRSEMDGRARKALDSHRSRTKVPGSA